MLAHVGGLPVEETAAALLSTGGAVLVAARLVASRYRRVQRIGVRRAIRPRR
jgi:hypothetical protein